MKKLIISLIIASSLPMAGSEMDSSSDRVYKKRPAPADAETSTPKQQKTDLDQTATPTTQEHDATELEDIFNLEQETPEQLATEHPTIEVPVDASFTAIDHEGDRTMLGLEDNATSLASDEINETPEQFQNRVMERIRAEHEAAGKRAEKQEARERVFKAIKTHDLAELQAALTYKPDIETPYVSNGQEVGTALQYALRRQYLSLPMIRTLIEHGANLDIEDEDGNGLFLSVFTILWNSAAPDVFFGRESRKTITDFIDLLIKHKTLDINEEYDDFGVLESCFRASSPNAFRFIYTKKFLDIGIRSQKNPDHRTALHAAIMELPTRLIPRFIKLLLKYENTVNLNTTSFAANGTPFRILCDQWIGISNDQENDEIQGAIDAYISAAQLLMEAGADATIVDKDEQTAISVLSEPCNHSNDDSDCEECAINHTCYSCSANRRLLNTIFDHMKYREQVPNVIKAAIKDIDKNPQWYDIAPIISSYVTALATPKPEQETPMIIENDKETTGTWADLGQTPATPATTVVTQYGTGVLGLDQE